ncbi:MAG: hypothetical protein KatS3mg102_2218 [Planctomycetota bacterium]|nr:MAG: hypothetical protein KatS3mg102_2218 [Planctomycetota bacterium]
MSWHLYRWTWRVKSPLYVGTTPSGALNRCRLYVPARPLWGALTAELARRQAAGSDPNYEQVGGDLRQQTRLSYLYPAEKVDGAWRAWLPEYRKGQGLVWVREDGTEGLPDRRFRRRLLWTRPATAIDPESDSALDGSLRETECLQTHWRDASGAAAGPVVMVGCVCVRDEGRWVNDICSIQKIFVGGDTRYGLGCLEQEEFVSSDRVFGQTMDGSEDSPRIASRRLVAHALGSDGAVAHGQLERLAGWDTAAAERPQQHQYGSAKAFWTPGTVFGEERNWVWSDDGTLRDLVDSQIDLPQGTP